MLSRTSAGAAYSPHDHLPSRGGGRDPGRQRRHRTPLGGRRSAARAARRWACHGRRPRPGRPRRAAGGVGRAGRARPHPGGQRQRPQPDERHRHAGQARHRDGAGGDDLRPPPRRVPDEQRRRRRAGPRARSACHRQREVDQRGGRGAPVRRLAALALLLPLAACGGGDEGDAADGGELTVLAAASLTDVFAELAVPFEEEHDTEVGFSFGSSTDLAGQAADGAPGDVLATADDASMAVAQDAGVTGDVETFATNVLTIVVPDGNPAGIASLDDLADATWVRCADEVPCGKVAAAVLDAAGVEADPVSLEDDVRATLDKVASGEADAGLVYASDAVAAADDVDSVEIPAADDALTSYSVATLDQSQDPALAADWVTWVTSDEARAILTDAGFGTP
ncbi:molybdate ABC transporter substrate-binding protein [Nocardioides sp. zg-1228]|nr:molybdate ABC transporter substrate-binding protein [Nocardioides sp. zg-1228]